MRIIFISVGLFLGTCTAQKSIIYSGRKISKSIENLHTMSEWLQHDLKDGVQVEHYEMLIDQTIYNLELNIRPKRPLKDYTGTLYLLTDNVEATQTSIDYGFQCGQISESYYEILTKDILRIKRDLNRIKSRYDKH